MPTTVRRLRGEGTVKTYVWILAWVTPEPGSKFNFLNIFWKETTDLIFKILFESFFDNSLMHTHGSSDHLINVTENRPI